MTVAAKPTSNVPNISRYRYAEMTGKQTEEYIGFETLNDDLLYLDTVLFAKP